MTGAQDFERVLDGSDKNVASFEHQAVPFVKRAQHFLHSTPAAVPLIATSFGLASVLMLAGGAYLLAAPSFFSVLRPLR